MTMIDTSNSRFPKAVAIADQAGEVPRLVRRGDCSRASLQGPRGNGAREEGRRDAGPICDEPTDVLLTAR
jgi:hypothetical protein